MSHKNTLIVGIGGAGANFINGLSPDSVRVGSSLLTITSNVDTVEESAGKVIYLEDATLNPLGNGSNGSPEIGRILAEVHLEKIMQEFAPYKRIIFVAGFGGGTGSGVTPYLVEEAMKQGNDVHCAIFMPFTFEGRKRDIIANEALLACKATNAHRYIFNNQDLFAMSDDNTTFSEAFRIADKALYKWADGMLTAEVCV